MLDERKIPYEYREYRTNPLSVAELRSLFRKLGATPRELLRRNDRACRELGIAGDESDAVLMQHMAQHPTLLQRPIGVAGNRAVVGRPVERLLDLT